MSEISMYEAQKKKMQGLCDEHDLTYRFKKDKYPITFTIRPSQGMDAQMTMLENVEEVGYRSPDASMMWIFEDGVLSTKVQGGTFTISKTLRTKIELVLVKMIAFWQQYFFRDIMKRGTLSAKNMPVIDDDDDLADDAEPLESFDDDELPNIDLPDDDGENEEVESVDADDPLIAEATRTIRHENKATVSLLQRHLQIGYAKAAGLMDALETLGVVGSFNGSDPREVLPYDEPVEYAAGDEEGDSDADEA